MKQFHKKLAGLMTAMLLGAIGTPSWAAPCFATNPLDYMSVNSVWGNRFHPKLGIWRLHNGLDLKAKTPLPMRAVDAGVVLKKGDHYGGGLNYVVQLDSGVVVKYFHASQQIREERHRLAPGDTLGLTGNTGEWTTGPHLHFEAHVNGKGVNPAQFLCKGGTLPMPPSAVLPPPPPGTPDPSVPVALPGGVVGDKTSPPIQNFPHMDSEAIRDFLYQETHKRFMNPQWYIELENPGAIQAIDDRATAKAEDGVLQPKIHMLRELNIMMALRNLMALEMNHQKEDIQSQLAALLSIDARNYSDKILDLTRASVASSR